MLGAVLEAPAIVAGFNDVAVMSEAVEQRRRHFGVDEDAWPFTEGEIGCDDHRGALIETADQVEQELPASLREGQIAKFVENDEVEAGEVIGKPSLAGRPTLGFKPVDEIDGGKETAAGARADAASRDGDGQMRLACASRDSDMAPGVWRVRRRSPTRSIRLLG